MQTARSLRPQPSATVNSRTHPSPSTPRAVLPAAVSSPLVVRSISRRSATRSPPTPPQHSSPSRGDCSPPPRRRSATAQPQEGSPSLVLPPPRTPSSLLLHHLSSRRTQSGKSLPLSPAPTTRRS